MASGKRGPPSPPFPGGHVTCALKRAERDDAGAGDGCRRVGVSAEWGFGGYQPGFARGTKRKKAKETLVMRWLEGGAEKYLRRVNLLLCAARCAAGSYANMEQVLGSGDLGPFPEAEPCRAAPAGSPVSAGLEELGNISNSPPFLPCYPSSF